MVNAEISDIEAVRDQLLEGVTELPIDRGEQLALWGESSYAIANYDGEGNSEPAIAVTTLGAGKVLALSESHLLDMDVQASSTSMVNLYSNGLDWLGADAGSKIVTYRDQGNADWLTSQGFTNVVNATESTLAQELADADVLILRHIQVAPETVTDSIRYFTVNGGGLFVAEGKHQSQWSLGIDDPDLSINQLLRDSGLGYRNYYWDS